MNSVISKFRKCLPWILLLSALLSAIGCGKEEIGYPPGVDARLIGVWKSPSRDTYVVFADNGTVAVSRHSQSCFAGRWSVHGSKLAFSIALDEEPVDLSDAPMRRWPSTEFALIDGKLTIETPIFDLKSKEFKHL